MNIKLDPKLDSNTNYNTSEYALTNQDNYKANISNNMNEILDKYVLLLLEYMSFVTENVSIKNEVYYKFILLRGIDTISHVFNFILLYTKNLDLTYYHSQKAFYFYVEFITQITDEQHSFLQLSSRDAVLFVYKRTIFEINSEQRRNLQKISKETTIKIDTLQNYITIFKTIIQYLFHSNEYTFTTKNDFIKKYIKHFLTICSKLNTHTLTKSKLDLLITFINSLADKKTYILFYFDLINCFIKKVCKFNEKTYLSISNIKTKIYADETNSMILSNEEPSQIVKWIFLL
jgi:hypothetical protein